MTTEQGNVLIAEFMQWGHDPEFDAYESEWALLIMAVEKIEGLGYVVKIYSNKCEIPEPNRKYWNVYYGNTKIEAVWQAVVQFINWYKESHK